jgi:hypothetical protein
MNEFSIKEIYNCRQGYAWLYVKIKKKKKNTGKLSCRDPEA